MKEQQEELIGDIIALFIFIILLTFAIVGMRKMQAYNKEQYQKDLYEQCDELKNIPDGWLWTTFPQCVMSRQTINVSVGE